jgi:pimeloyl-ACP methyl ester carboxylesterase
MSTTAPVVSEFEVDVAAALPFGDERNWISSTVYEPAGEPRAVLVVWPGGSYARSYWNFDAIPGYDFASWAAARGFVVVAADHLGNGESSRPEAVDEVDFKTMAAAADRFVAAVRKRFPGTPVVGIGHSLGGALTVVTQAEHRTYDRIASLGMTHGAKGSVTGDVGDGEEARAAALAQAPTFLEDFEAGYATGYRKENHSWLYFEDTPEEVMEADDLTAAAWPRQAYVDGLTVGYSAEFAARVECPVFLAFGDHDIPEEPRDDVAFYRASDDITLLVLADAAHCHNFASTRTVLWDRLLGWATDRTDDKE